jgi:NADH:ubiquinone oxidoreductase subunit F (NADH-binding)/NAD-dependent dihydropyrimidine dehydrogenase PreA subunit
MKENTIENNCWKDTGTVSQELLKVLESGNFTIKPGDKKLVSKYTRETIEKPVIFVGAGTCGLGAGAKATKIQIEKYLKEKDIDAEIIEVGCIGLCSAEPLVDIQIPGKTRISFKNITAEKVEPLMESFFSGSIPQDSVLGQFQCQSSSCWDDIPHLTQHPFFAPQTRWVLINCGIVNPLSIEEYISRGGYASLHTALSKHLPQGVCDEVEKSGLRGRGGGGFPTGKKWKFAASGKADQKYLVCNADEGDPGAFMDRAVIEGDPFRLLEGMAIAAYGIGATKGYIYIRAEYPLAIERLRHSIAVAEKYGLLGKDILGTGFHFDLQIKMGAGAFVCGEETALLNSIEGKRGMPKPRPPYPAVSGLFGKPTIINNVETFANVPMVFYKGADYFSSHGTETSKGTKVFALSGKVERTGLVEVEMGTTVREIVFAIGGGVPGGKKYKAAQIGGPSGGCIPDSQADIEVDYEQLKTVGAMMGSGGLVVMDENTCMVDVAKFFMDFIQRESCGKCIPCREGTKRLLEILESITKGRKGMSEVESLQRMQGIINMEQLAEVICSTSLCGLGQTAANPVLSTLNWFRHEYEEHIFDRHCSAGVCKELINYEIDEHKCKGCTLCAKKCPVDAIMGKPKAPHYIIPDKCIGCGQCVEACPFDAVFTK